jgi:hypothetical protein
MVPIGCGLPHEARSTAVPARAETRRGVRFPSKSNDAIARGLLLKSA